MASTEEVANKTEMDNTVRDNRQLARSKERNLDAVLIFFIHPTSSSCLLYFG
jgi:hypothetical protein